MIYVYSLWRCTKGNNFRDLYVGNAVARSTCTQITLEIDLRGHDCQTHHGEYARLHSLYLGLHHPAVKMFCALALPPWMTGMTLRALATIFTGFLQCCPNDQSFNSLLADLHHTVHLQAVCTLLIRFSHGQNFVFCLFTNSPSWNELHLWTTGILRWPSTAVQTVWSPNRNHVSSSCWFYWASVILDLCEDAS